MTKKQQITLNKLVKILNTLPETHDNVINILSEYVYGDNTVAQTKRHLATFQRAIERDLKLVHRAQALLNNCPTHGTPDSKSGRSGSR